MLPKSIDLNSFSASEYSDICLMSRVTDKGRLLVKNELVFIENELEFDL